MHKRNYKVWYLNTEIRLDKLYLFTPNSILFLYLDVNRPASPNPIPNPKRGNHDPITEDRRLLFSLKLTTTIEGSKCPIGSWARQTRLLA